MTAQFSNIDNTGFTLNGIPYNKVFLALPSGDSAIRVECAYESNNTILSTTLISEIEVEGQVYGTVSELITALKPMIYNPVGSGGGNGGSGGTTVYQGTVEHFLDLTGIDTSVPELDYIAAAVQSNGAFTCDAGQQMVFFTTVINTNGSIIKRWYRVFSNVTTIGGTGSVVDNSMFMPDGQIEIDTESNSDLFINLGTITSPDTVESVFNLGDSGSAWIIAGEKFITAIIDSVATTWRFTGGNGDWGGSGSLTATANDFDNLSNQPTEDVLSQIFLGVYTTLAELQTAHPTANSGQYADVDAGVSSVVQRYIWDNNDGNWTASGSGGAGGAVNSVVAGDDIDVDNSDAANPVVKFSPSATDSLTGTTLLVNDNVKNKIYNQTAPSSSSTFDVGAIKRGAEVVNYIDTTGKGSFPEITNIFGAKQQTQSNDFRTGAIFKMIVFASTDTDVEYFFIDYLGNNSASTGLPATSIINVVPPSLPPSAQQLVTIYSDYITNATTVLFEGQTIDSINYGFDSNNVKRIECLVTTGATEGAFDITLNNGTTTVFTDSLEVSIGTAFIPTPSDWENISGSIDTSSTGNVKVNTLGVTGSATWNKEIDYQKDWTIRFEVEQSIHGWLTSSAYEYFLKLVKVSDDTDLLRIWGRTYNNTYWQMTTDSDGSPTDKLLLSTSGGATQGDSFNILTSGKIFEIRFVSGALYFYEDDVLKHTYADVLSENLKLKMNARYFDTVNIKYIELP